MLRQQATFKRKLFLPVKVFYVGWKNKWDGVFVSHHAIKHRIPVAWPSAFCRHPVGRKLGSPGPWPMKWWREENNQSIHTTAMVSHFPTLNANTECSCKHFCSSTPLRHVVEKDQSLFTQRKPVWIHTVSWINRIQWWDKIHWIVHESDFFWKTHHSTGWCLCLNLCSAINEASDSILDVQSHAIYSMCHAQ